eukprot:TRINITY_DN1491_c0_g1_i2.p1 TRINITY_DN1491_c0_g1~~TRINITY_DN1491_c0_g1_i2.p1  ORF type:complete len:393 (+),score=129.43 TRINITY_DN1491_c0_g1_i2:174-1181(+)
MIELAESKETKFQQSSPKRRKIKKNQILPLSQTYLDDKNVSNANTVDNPAKDLPYEEIKRKKMPPAEGGNSGSTASFFANGESFDSSGSDQYSPKGSPAAQKFIRSLFEGKSDSENDESDTNKNHNVNNYSRRPSFENHICQTGAISVDSASMRSGHSNTSQRRHQSKQRLDHQSESIQIIDDSVNHKQQHQHQHEQRNAEQLNQRQTGDLPVVLSSETVTTSSLGVPTGDNPVMLESGMSGSMMDSMKRANHVNIPTIERSRSEFKKQRDTNLRIENNVKDSKLPSPKKGKQQSQQQQQNQQQQQKTKATGDKNESLPLKGHCILCVDDSPVNR